MPGSVDLNILFDRTISDSRIRGRHQVHLALTVALVVMVIGLFLRNLSSTIIPSLALPMSIIGTFAVMYMMRYSVNNLSRGLTLRGFVVDDIIVMLENIVRHMEKGRAPSSGR
jgi:HAE1 family hydrophobic/amphiphilic exporter-1